MTDACVVCKRAELRAEIKRLQTDLQIMIDSYSEISRVVGRQGSEEHSLADDVRALRADNERLRAALQAARVVVEATGARATLVIVDAALKTRIHKP